MTNASFFIYLFASCIGVAIAAILLLVFRVQTERAPWKNLLMIFVAVTFLFCLLLFVERFYTDNFATRGGWSMIERSISLLLGFGQIFIWCWFLRERAEAGEKWIRTGTNGLLIGILLVQMIVYLFLMDDHYYIASPQIRGLVSGIYILFMVLQTGILGGYMYMIRKRIAEAEPRRFLNGISMLLLLGFLWEDFYIIMLFRSSPLLEKGLYAGFDFVSVLFLLIYLLTALYVYRCEIMRMIPADGEQGGAKREEEILKELRQGGLSEREIEVARLLLDGSSYDQIAEKLYISKNTVKRHAHNIYQKLEVGNKVQLISKYR